MSAVSSPPGSLTRSTWFWVLLALAVTALALGAVALGLELTRPSGPALIRSESFIVGQSDKCPNQIYTTGPPPYCSTFNITVPGPSGSLRATLVTIVPNASCGYLCNVEARNVVADASQGMPFDYGNSVNGSQAISGVLQAGPAYVQVHQMSGYCNFTGSNCTFYTPLRFDVAIYDLGEVNY